MSARRFNLCAVALALVGATNALADTPGRVVSINLCTDELALLLAAPGQILSVSKLSADPAYDVDVPDGVAINGGMAEEVHALSPDLILAGAYSGGATGDMLKRLGHPVEVFQPAASLNDIRANLRQMGALLGREGAAETAIAQFDADLAALQDNGPRPRAALWFANGYAPGPATLAGQILDAAGYANIAVEAGISGTGFLSLEELVLLDPDVIVTGQSYPGSSRAEDIMRHPVVAALNGTKSAPVTDRDWVCGTPRILRAVKSLRAARLSSEGRG